VAPKTCLVCFFDGRGSRHSVEVFAESLFEAAALGSQLRDEGWLQDKPGPATRLEILVKSPEVIHQVSLQQITRWLDGASISPNEMVRKQRLKALLGG
jgi:hypothetical protein